MTSQSMTAFIIAIIVVVVAGAAYALVLALGDRRRGRDVENEQGRLEQSPEARRRWRR